MFFENTVNNTRVNLKYGFDLRAEIDTPSDGSRRGYSKTGLEKTNRRILVEEGGEEGIKKIELKITIRNSERLNRLNRAGNETIDKRRIKEK